MYEAFYGLTEAPFRLTPDPHYLYLGAHHREALGHLLFGIREGSGFIAVTGEIGTGKTTLLRALLRDLEPNTVVAYVFNPALSDLELLQTINGEFRLQGESTSKKELVDQLNRFLVAQKAVGARVVLIIDEAQSLEPTVLEQLRLLSNLETETEKLLQIVLVGQPELRDMLSRPSLAQLTQRITVRWHLVPLDRAETTNYVRHRLRIAGGAGATTLFTPPALRLIYRYSRGVPRLINIAAHRALLAGYTQERPRIGAHTTRKAIGELRRDDAYLQARPRILLPALGAATAALTLALAAALAVLPARDPQLLALAPETMGTPQTEAVATAAGDARVATRIDKTAAEVDIALGVPSAAEGPALVAPHIQPSPTAREAEALVPTGPADLAPVPGASPAMKAAGGSADSVLLWSALATADHRASAFTATTDLLAAWKVEPLRPEESARPTLDLDAIAARRGLRYLRTAGNLARLQLLNLPAILELSVPNSGQRRFAMLASLEQDQPTVRYGIVAARLSSEAIGQAWLGDAHLFWRDFEGLSPYLATGSIGPEVERLQRLLARLGEYDNETSPIYDSATAEAIARFQRSRRLPPDGIVGPLTKIVLYDAVAGYEHPRLGGGK